MEDVADVEQPQAGGDERAGDDLRVHPRGDVAVVGRVALGGTQRARVAVGRVVLGGLVDLQAQVGDHERRSLIADVDDPRRADRVRIALRVERGGGVLVELEHVGMAVLGERESRSGESTPTSRSGG